MDLGNEVFHVRNETLEVDVGKNGENNEIQRRQIGVHQLWVGCDRAVDIEVL